MSMIEVKDRIPTYPGRVKLVPVVGQPNTYDMVRADEPIEVGTPINRALFKAFIDEMNAIRQQINDKIFEMAQRVEVGNLADGAVFGLYENGVLIPYVKLQNGYENSERVLVIRRDITHLAALYTASQQRYSTSDLDAWLNEEFIQRFDVGTRSVISEVNIETMLNDWEQEYVLRKVFLLSSAEYQVDVRDTYTLGSAVAVFNSNDRRIAMYDGTPSAYHTRTNLPYYDTTVVIGADGIGVADAINVVAGIRPALTLPASFEVTAGVPSTENVMVTAEVL
jgi:hypothetical protein